MHHQQSGLETGGLEEVLGRPVAGQGDPVHPGTPLGPEPVERPFDQEVAETLFQILGHRVLEGAGQGAPFAGAMEDHWRYAQASTVAAGAIEIQRETVARAVLGRADGTPAPSRPH